MSDNQRLYIVGISGSLRKASMNTGLLRAAQKLLPDGVSMEIVKLDALPLYNGDIDGPVQPEPVQALKAAFARADGVLLASPEYNHSFTAALKNALDWASRPQSDATLVGLPVAIIGAGGKSGTVHGQLQLRQVLEATRSLPMSQPEFLLSMARDKFDGDGNLLDEVVKRDLAAFLRAFVEWIEHVREAEKVVA